MMIFLKLLLIVSSVLIFIAATTSIRNEFLCFHPSKHVIPFHYDIKLESPCFKRNIFYGEYNISLNILNKTRHIYLYSALYLGIKDIVLIKNFERYHENDKDTVYKLTYSTNEDTINISLLDELSPGNYTLNIKYYGTAYEVFKMFDKKQTWIGGLHFQIIGTRPFFQKFSCLHLHDLRLRATFNISIKCDRCTALSNMPLRNTKVHKHDMLWIQNDTTPVMWPDQATIIMSNNLFHIFHIDNEIIKMWTRIDAVVHMEYAKNVAENITLFFNNKWKHSNKILMVSHVAIPNFHDKDTIVFGLVFYRETDIIYDKNLYSIAHKIEVAQLVGHKMTQQWFNNMMNNPLVSDFWFKKGLITLLATYAVNEIYPDYRIINLFVVQNQHYSFHLDSDYYIWNYTSQINSSLEIPNSIRAPFIMRMMEHAFTKEIFWKSIRSYINNTQLHRTSFEDFLKEMIATTDKPDTALTTIDYWAVVKHCPLIKIRRNYTHPFSRTKISIENIDTLNISCLPITFATQTYSNFNNFSHITLCKRRSYLTFSLPFKENGWMIFNVQQIGYYRVNYDDDNWKRISYYLHHDDYTKIHVLNRAQLIYDTFHLMIADQKMTYIFLDIILYLKREEDYIAWYPMFKALEYIFSTSFAVLKENNRNLQNRIMQGLNGVLEKIKYKEIDDTDKLRIRLRQEAAKWACFLGDLTCIKEANNALTQHIKHTETHRLLPWWKEWTYCNGLMKTKEETTWQLVYDIGLNKSDTKFLDYLACSEDTNLIKKYLRFNQNISTEQEYSNSFNSFLHIITKHMKNRDIMVYIINDFFNIKPKHVGIIAALLIIINNIYCEYEAEYINEYVMYLMTDEVLYAGMKEKDSIIHNYDNIVNKTSIRKNQIRRQKLQLCIREHTSWE